MKRALRPSRIIEAQIEFETELLSTCKLKEENYRLATLDEEVPAKYQCDDFTHAKPFVSHLQESEDWLRKV